MDVFHLLDPVSAEHLSETFEDSFRLGGMILGHGIADVKAGTNTRVRAAEGPHDKSRLTATPLSQCCPYPTWLSQPSYVADTFEVMYEDSVRETVRQFMAEREWQQFHTPENLAKSVSIEAAELLECFQWGGADLESAKDELADVLTYCLLLADRLDLDPDTIVLDKLARTNEKYPVEKARGTSVKYDRL